MQIGFVRKLFIAELVLLFAEFAVGMFVNMYESVPFQVDFASFAYSPNGIGFGVHHYVAILNLLVAVVALIASLRIKNSLLSKLSGLGLVLLIIAYGTGTVLIFVEDNDLYSLAMAITTISAVIVYVSGVFLARTQHT